MKKITFLILMIFVAVFSYAQHNVLEYGFENSLAEKKGNGPELQMLDSAGVFVVDTLNEINNKTKEVYRFRKNCGLQFNNALAGNFLGMTYSIELYFRFDELGSMKRVVDWKNRTNEFGAYIINGRLGFYPWIYLDTVLMNPGEYSYNVITRDSASKIVTIFTGTKLDFTFPDFGSLAVLDSSNVLNFFRDDLVIQDEASSGAVALLNIYNYVLDSTVIRQHFNNLQGEIFSAREIKKQNNFRVYPNPASDKIVIDLSPMVIFGMAKVSLLDLTSSVVYTKVFNAGSRITLDVNALQLNPGIYFVKAETESVVSVNKVVIRK